MIKSQIGTVAVLQRLWVGILFMAEFCFQAFLLRTVPTIKEVFLCGL